MDDGKEKATGATGNMRRCTDPKGEPKIAKQDVANVGFS